MKCIYIFTKKKKSKEWTSMRLYASRAVIWSCPKFSALRYFRGNTWGGNSFCANHWNKHDCPGCASHYFSIQPTGGLNQIRFTHDLSADRGRCWSSSRAHPEHAKWGTPGEVCLLRAAVGLWTPCSVFLECSYPIFIWKLQIILLQNQFQVITSWRRLQLFLALPALAPHPV